ncbi:Sec-independent protein translocase protein TatB [Nocardia carnea]|uniref:Sec-independent protein translocase protein TatB n=1 Tax=Nocardia carnea TaxID=37328 RepID=A0ABW7TMC5_9NOCA|nr:Sec-independent protein translocase protein TatB [Nocardia carnea]
MFSSIGWGEVLVLLVAALVILGPERLPEAARWTARALRQARDYATGATAELKRDLGPEFDELRAPLSELRRLRGIDPQSLVTRHLLGDEPLIPDDVRASLTGLNAEKIDSGNFGLMNLPAAAATVDLTKRPPHNDPNSGSDDPGDRTRPGEPAH